MTKRSKVILGISVAALLIAAGTLGSLVVWNWLSQPIFRDQEHLTDEVLIQNFRDHRADFERIRSMLEHDDQIFRIDEDWSDPSDIPSDKLTEYRRLFVVIGTPRGFYNRRNPLRMEFISTAQGWVGSGTTKGYLYMPHAKAEGEWRDSLDDTSKLSRLDVYYMRPLDENWYLYFQRS
jgi:hypothetical protein